MGKSLSLALGVVAAVGVGAWYFSASKNIREQVENCVLHKGEDGLPLLCDHWSPEEIGSVRTCVESAILSGNGIADEIVLLRVQRDIVKDEIKELFGERCFD